MILRQTNLNLNVGERVCCVVGNTASGATYLFELQDNEHVRATAVGVHVSGSSGPGPGPLFHQLLHLRFKIHTLT